MQSLRLLLSNSHDPWFNLSIEEYIFKNMSQNQSILFLWRNYNTVVIGRAQNAWKECNTGRMEKDGIRLARRSSGGGAVFHDLGNTCFTFMSTQKQYNKNISFKIILDGLKNLGITAFIAGRNDLIVNTINGPRKISGSAYRETSTSKLHHGTLLLHVNLDKLKYYLNPNPKKLITKGIDSIQSRVINLNQFIPDINHHIVSQKIKEAFFKHYNMEVLPEIISTEEIYNIPDFIDEFNKKRHWNWNFGNTPIFMHQLNNNFDWGNIELHFNIEHGIISHSCIFTDSLDPDPLEELSKKLVGVLYNAQNIQNCCEQWMKNWPPSQELMNVTTWLIENII